MAFQGAPRRGLAQDHGGRSYETRSCQRALRRPTHDLWQLLLDRRRLEACPLKAHTNGSGRKSGSTQTLRACTENNMALDQRLGCISLLEPGNSSFHDRREFRSEFFE